MLERLAADATKAVFLAQEEARRLGHNYVDTEILMLGLLTLASSTPAGLSETLRPSLKAAHKAIESVIGRGSDFVSRDPPFTPMANLVIQSALKTPRGKANAEQLFRALLFESACNPETECDAVQVLESLSVDTNLIADSLKQLSAQDATPKIQWGQGRAYSHEEALSNVFGLESFIDSEWVPPEMLDWFDEEDDVLGVYVNAEDDVLVFGERGICWYDGQAKTYIKYRSIDRIEQPAHAEDPYLKLVLRPKGKVLMLPVLHSTEDFPDYVDVYEYLSFCTTPKATKMDIQDIQSKDDLIYFLRQPTVHSTGFQELTAWLDSGGPKPSWLEPLNIAPETLNDANVWRLFALMLIRIPNAAVKD